jgi:hypothetical protein
VKCSYCDTPRGSCGVHALLTGAQTFSLEPGLHIPDATRYFHYALFPFSPFPHLTPKFTIPVIILSRAMLPSWLYFEQHSLSARQQQSNEFINPPNASTSTSTSTITRISWALGSIQTLRWTTTYSSISLYLTNGSSTISTLLSMR